MAAPVRVSERDLRTLLGIVSGDRGDLPAKGLPPSLLWDLWGLIPSDFVTCLGLDSGRQERWFGQDIPAGNGDAAGKDAPEVFWDHFWASKPCSYPDRTGDLRSIVTGIALSRKNPNTSPCTWFEPDLVTMFTTPPVARPYSGM